MAVDVPRAPGVPSVDFAAAAGEVLTFLTRDLITVFGTGRPQWGIYLGGAPVVLADSVLTFNYKHTWSLSDYPVERGAFETYNKVQIPYDGRFRFAAGGSEANRQALLDSVAAIAGSMTLYNIVTPEAVYLSVSVVRYDYSRQHNQGLGLIVVDVDTLEVRQVASAAMSSTREPTSAGQVNGGSVQTVPPTPYESSTGPFIVGPGGKVAGPV